MRLIGMFSSQAQCVPNETLYSTNPALGEFPVLASNGVGI